MADSPVSTTLLKLTADGSQLKQEIREEIDALRSLKTAAAEVGDIGAQVSALGPRGRELFGTYKAFGDTDAEALAAAQKKMTEDLLGGTEKAAVAQQNLNQAMQQGQAGREAMLMTLGRINPELATMMNVAMRGKEALAMMWNPFILGGAAALSSIMAAIDAVTRLIEEGKRAEEQWKQTTEAMQGDKDRRRKQQEDIGTTLARAGIFGKEDEARQIESKFLTEGLPAEAVREALPFAFDGAGQYVGDQAFVDLIGYADLGKGQLDASDAASRRKSMREFQREGRRSPAIREQRRAFYAGRQANRRGQAMMGDRSEIARYLQETEGLEGDALDRAVQDTMEVIGAGTVQWRDEKDAQGNPIDITMAGNRGEIESRQREAARRARAVGAISEQQFRQRGAAEFGLTWTGRQELGIRENAGTAPAAGVTTQKMETLLQQIVDNTARQSRPVVNVNMAKRGNAPMQTGATPRRSG